MILDKLLLKNFKSHKDREIKFGKITVLIGHNNGGKSSILQSLVMLSQSVKMDDNRLRTNNDVIDLGKYDDVVTLGDIENNISIGINFREKIHLGGNYDGVIEQEYAKCLFRVTSSKNDIQEVYVGVDSDHTQFNATWTPSGFKGHLIRPFEQNSFDLQLTQFQGLIPRMQINNDVQRKGQSNIRIV